jgi:hypothetical protein
MVAPAALIYMAYTTLAFGGPLALGYGHLAGPDEFQQGQAQGVFGVTYPHLEAIWQTTFGPYRGIFLLSPVLLLALPALVLLYRRTGWRADALVCAAIGVGFFSSTGRTSPGMAATAWGHGMCCRLCRF